MKGSAREKLKRALGELNEPATMDALSKAARVTNYAAAKALQALVADQEVEKLPAPPGTGQGIRFVFCLSGRAPLPPKMRGFREAARDARRSKPGDVVALTPGGARALRQADETPVNGFNALRAWMSDEEFRGYLRGQAITSLAMGPAHYAHARDCVQALLEIGGAQRA